MLSADCVPRYIPVESILAQCVLWYTSIFENMEVKCVQQCVSIRDKKELKATFLLRPPAQLPPRQRREFASIVQRYLLHHLPGEPGPQCRLRAEERRNSSEEL